MQEVTSLIGGNRKLEQYGKYMRKYTKKVKPLYVIYCIIMFNSHNACMIYCLIAS